MEYLSILFFLLIIALFFKVVLVLINLLRRLPWQVVIFGFVVFAFAVFPASRYTVFWYCVFLIGYIVSLMKTYIEDHR